MGNVESIVEGCMPDTPSRVMYCSIELTIPKNVTMLFKEHPVHPIRYLLYAKTPDFEELQVVHNPYFKGNLNKTNPNKLLKGGWPILKFDPKFDLTFDAQRSLTTRDGRIFVNSLYFHESWRWYLDVVPTILRECGMIFRGEATEGDFEKHPSRTF